MRLLLEAVVVFFALLTIYRRLIEPFIEGLKGETKPYNKTDAGWRTRFGSQRKKVKHVDPKEIQDAEFEEIK